MNCNEVAAILDTHRSARLAAAERAAVDMHLLECDDCAAAWHAQTELLALRVPPMPATLPERALLAARAPQSAEPRRARMPIVIGSVLLAGAALAGVTIVSLTRAPSAPQRIAGGRRAAGARRRRRHELRERRSRLRARSATARRPSSSSRRRSASSPLVRHPPSYPPEALAARRRGTRAAQVRRHGGGRRRERQRRRVERRALRGSGYRSGRAVALPAAHRGRQARGARRVSTRSIRFALGKEPPPDARRASKRSSEAAQEAAREFAAFSAGLEVALDRLAADDLRGAELQLDEMQAVYGAERMRSLELLRLPVHGARQLRPRDRCLRDGRRRLRPRGTSDARRRSCRSRTSTSRAISTTWR